MAYSGAGFPGLDLYCTDPAQYLTTAGLDLSGLSVRRVYSVGSLLRWFGQGVNIKLFFFRPQRERPKQLEGIGDVFCSYDAW